VEGLREGGRLCRALCTMIRVCWQSIFMIMYYGYECSFVMLSCRLDLPLTFVMSDIVNRSDVMFTELTPHCSRAIKVLSVLIVPRLSIDEPIFTRAHTRIHQDGRRV